jgi:hypothetical protein
MFTRLPYSSYIASATIARDMAIVSQIGPTIAEGPAKLMVLRQNSLVRSVPPKENRVRDKATQRVASSWHFLGPHQGDSASSSFVSKSWP